MLKLVPEPNNRSRLVRQHFYLSPCPFNLTSRVDLSKAPSRKSYYTAVHSSSQLIEWLEANNCDTVYCRELVLEEVTCKIGDKGCVPEFVHAYNEALQKLKNSDKARKWITMYGPLSKKELRVGFYLAKKVWLQNALNQLENAMKAMATTSSENPFIKSAFTDEEGNVFFYDLCPTTTGTAYYFSSIAPIENGGPPLYWDSTISSKISDTLSATATATITLAFPTGDPNKDKDGQKKLFGKTVTARADEQKVSGP